MLSLSQQLHSYAAYHQDFRNKLTHFFGVPLVVFGLFVPLIHPCPSNPNEFQIGNDSPGVAEATFPSARAALGRHRLVSRGGDGAFAATFTLRRLR